MGVMADGRRAGPWPHWLHWAEGQGLIQRDYRIEQTWHELFLNGNMRPGQAVADAVGVSRSTVSRAMQRMAQRRAGAWPPPIPNGFGYSAKERRRARLRASGYALQDDGSAVQLDPYTARYQAPEQWQDQPDEDGQGWATWTG
jgi:DNA-binding transcriptional MocR family regulator